MINSSPVGFNFAGTLLMLAAAFGLGASLIACTPATADPPGVDASTLGTGGNTASGSGGTTAAGSGGNTTTGSGGTTTTGSGGNTTTGSGGTTTGSGGTTTGSGGTTTGSGGTTTGSGGTTTTGSGGRTGTGGTTVATGGATGTGGRAGTGGAGGATATTGCPWQTQAGKIVLFDGTNMDQWKNLRTGAASHWRLIPGELAMEVVPAEPPTDLQTKMKFENLCVHVEYLTPMYPSNVTGQSRGNSGVYLKSAYEIQILDSIGQAPAIDSCGAVYSVKAPLTIACNMELVWNTLEIEFKASEWSGTTKTKNAVMVSATLNGKLVQQNVDLNVNVTQAGQQDLPGPQSLMLQDHRNLVRFRNIWVIPR